MCLPAAVGPLLAICGGAHRRWHTLLDAADIHALMEELQGQVGPATRAGLVVRVLATTNAVGGDTGTGGVQCTLNECGDELFMPMRHKHVSSGVGRSPSALLRCCTCWSRHNTNLNSH